MIRVLVVEDERTLASALEVAIDVQADLQCVGAVGTVAEALELAKTHQPDVVIMDVQLPGPDGIAGARKLKQLLPHVRVLILTGNASAELLSGAAAAGAAGFLAKDSSFPDILSAIRAPSDERILVDGRLLATLIQGISPISRQEAPNWPRLTKREMEVLHLMGEGLDPRAISERLVVSLHTVRGHVKNIMMKLGAHSQLEAVVVAGRTGLLPDQRRR